jgi:nucleoside-diphosphate-sugar epimerase
MHVLVTGNQGYIGSVLTPLLAAAGHTVTGLDAGFFADCLLMPFEDGVERQIRKDVRDVTESDLQGIDAIVHLAAISNDPMGALDPSVTYEINQHASVRLAELARSAGVRKFIFASSCSVYGQSDTPSLDEGCPLNPQTAYAVSKVRAEREIELLATPSFSPIFMRNATVYGCSPRLRMDLAINNLTGSGYVSGQVTMLSDGMAWRPFVGVRNLAEVTWRLLESDVHNEAFNVGSNAQNFLIRDLAAEIGSTIGCPVKMGPGASADSRTYNVSFDKLATRFPDFKPLDTIQSTVKELCMRFEQFGLDQEAFESSRFVRLKRLQELIASGELDETFRSELLIAA